MNIDVSINKQSNIGELKRRKIFTIDIFLN